MTITRIVVVLLLQIFLATALGAQTASLTGRVSDPQGSVVVDAVITLTAANTSIPQTTRSTADGTFSFTNIPSGSYQLQADAPGFELFTQEITIAGQTQTVDLALHIATISESILVSATAQRGLVLAQPSNAGGRLNLTSFQTPASVTVLPGDMIRDWGYQNVAEAKSRAPGISSSPSNGNGLNSLSSRGFFGSNSVAQLYDGIQLITAGNVVAFPFDPWNVEEIDVLNGPASVLYGAGAIGGALNVISKKPNPRQRFHQAQVSFGSYRTVKAALDTTGPINDRLSYRFNVSNNYSHHWVDRGESRSLALSAALRFEARRNLIFSISDDYGNIHPTTYEGTPTYQGKIVPGTRFKNYNFTDAETNFRENRVRLNTEWSPSSNITFVNDASVIGFTRLYRYTYSFTYVPATNQIRRTTFRNIDSPQRQLGDTGYARIRMRLLGLANEVVAGFSVNRSVYDRIDNTVPTYNGGLSFHDPLVFDPGTFVTSGAPTAFPQYDLTTKQYGGFMQDRLTLSQKWSVVTGVRWDNYKTHLDDYITRVQTRGTFTGAGYNAGLVYNPVRTVALYAQYAKAVDPVSSLASIGAGQVRFDLSPGRQIEAGAKQSLWNGRAEWTFSGYRIIKKKLLTPSSTNPSLTEQVGQQSSKGVELSFGFRPLERWNIEGNGTVLNARFDDFFASIGGRSVSLAGYTPQWVPERIVNLRTSWDFNSRLQVRAALRYVDTRYADNPNTIKLAPYGVTDFGARWLASEKLRVDVRLDNAFDKLYAPSAQSANPTQWLLGPPRTFSAGLNVAF